MRNILLASAVALGLSSGAAFAATGYVYPDRVPTTIGQVPSQAVVAGETSGQFSSYATHAGANPTGETEYGPRGAISLWEPDVGGGGSN